MTASHVLVEEGAVSLRVPSRGKARGPAAPTRAPFYSEAATLTRDLSVAFVASLRRPDLRALDGLCGSGVRAIRWWVEAGLRNVAACDKNPRSVELARENASAAGADVHVERADLRAYLSQTLWEHVEIDPFGSPAPFADAAIPALKLRSTLALTATDGAALAGQSPAACRRKYGARSLRCDIRHELGLRILAGFGIVTAARHERAARPVLAHVADHYYRVYFELAPGARRADALLDRLRLAWVCGECGRRGWCDEHSSQPVGHPSDCRGAPGLAGPLYAGPLTDPACARAMLEALPTLPWQPDRANRARTLLGTVAEEASVDALPVALSTLARLHGGGPPKPAELLAALRGEGHEAVRAHAGDVLVKTDAPWDDLLRAVRRTAP
ncbi:MAG TPA: hypothetical protein VM681_08665 [Candidatus Thermoplasmatota archaeon]|nr:hypothetical protein [Candidatus Thermoplasmatota archaeon]